MANASTHGWPEADKQQLRVLWGAGHSTTEIGRMMRRSKNSIVGMAHRTGLPGRPSPIVPRTQPKLVKVKRAPKMTLAVIEIAPEPFVPFVSAAPVYLGRVQPCCYVVRSEGRRHWQCDAPSRPRSPYCDFHHAACHKLPVTSVATLPPVASARAA